MMNLCIIHFPMDNKHFVWSVGERLEKLKIFKFLIDFPVNGSAFYLHFYHGITAVKKFQ